MPPVVALALAELIIVGVALAVSRRHLERAALVLLCVAAPLEVYRTSVGGYNVSLFRLSLLLVVAFLLIRDWRGVLSWARHPAVIAYGALALLMALSLVILSVNDFLGQRALAQVLVGMVAIPVVAYLAGRQPLRFVLGALLLGGALPLLAAIYQGLSGLFGPQLALPLLDQLPLPDRLEILRRPRILIGTEGLRANGPFVDPNHLGVFLSLLCVIALAFTVNALRRRQDGRAVAFWGLSLAGVAIVAATLSRTAWLALALGVGVLLWATVRAARARLLGPISPRRMAVAGFVVVLLLLPLAPRVVERLDPGADVNQTSIQEHARTTGVAWDSFLEHPFFGIGVSDLAVTLRLNVRTSVADSSYLTFAAELGVLGLLAVMLAAGAVLYPLLQAGKELDMASEDWLYMQSLVAAYMAFLVANLTYYLWLDDFHWIVLGATLGAAGAVLQGRRAPEPRRRRSWWPGRPRLLEGA